MTALEIGAILLGLPAGLVLARLSVRMPQAKTAPSPRRQAVLAVACAGLAAWSVLVHPGAQGVLGALLAWQLLLLAVLDAEHFWLPRVLTLPLAASGLAASLALGPSALMAAVIGAAAGYLALAVLAWGYRRLRGHDGLGGGDAYLLGAGGAWIGWISLPTALVWAAAGGLGALAILAMMGRPVGARQPIPFGVFLAFGIWLAWLYGPIGR